MQVGLSKSIFVGVVLLFVTMTTGIGSADSINLELVSTYITADRVQDVAVAGNYAYLACEKSGLEIVDISNPLSPTLAGMYDTGIDDTYFAHYTTSVTVVGNYAYVADSHGGLVIVDITNPLSPTLAGNCYTPDWAEDVAVVGNYAYVASAQDGLFIINVTNPSSPTLAGSCNDSCNIEYATAIAVAGNYAYVADYDTGDLVIVDISNPVSSTCVGRYNGGASASDVAVAGNYVYVTYHSYREIVDGQVTYHDDTGSLQIIDISNPTSPRLVGTYATRPVKWVHIAGNYAYIGSHPEIIDINNPSLPTLAETYGKGTFTGVDVSNGYAYFTRWQTGLVILRLDSRNQKMIPTNLVVDILSPSENFKVSQFDNTIVKAKVTDNLGNPIKGSGKSLVQATFSNGDDQILLFDDGTHNDETADDGIYANEWIPTTVSPSCETACTIKVSAQHSTLGKEADEVSGIVKTGLYEPKIIIPISSPRSQEAYIGTELAFKFKVVNNGNSKDTIKLNLNDLYGWDTTLSKNTVTLSPGQENEIYLTVTLNGESKPNQYTIEAISSTDESKKDRCYFVTRTTNTYPLMIRMSFENSIDKETEHILNFNTKSNVKLEKKTMILPGDLNGENQVLFDPVSSSKDKDSFEIEIEDTNTNEKTVVPIKINDSCEIITSDYDITRDSYNFPNWGGIRYILNKGWFGHCYGVSTTDILFYEKIYKFPDFSTDVEYTYKFKRNDVEDLIKAHQRNQDSKLASQITKGNINERDEYFKLKDSIDSGNPIMILGDFGGLHAIVAYMIVEADNKAFILCYDCNEPYTPSNFEKSFSYGVLNLDTWELFFEKYTHDPIDFIVEKPSVLSDYDQYVFECPVNVTIKDDFGRILSDSGIKEIPNSTVMMINDTKVFHVPHNGSYQVIIDAYDSGTFSITRVSPSDSEVSIAKCVNIPVTPNTRAFVTTSPENTNYTVNVDTEGDGSIDNVYSPQSVSFGINSAENSKNSNLLDSIFSVIDGGNSEEEFSTNVLKDVKSAIDSMSEGINLNPDDLKNIGSNSSFYSLGLILILVIVVIALYRKS